MNPPIFYAPPDNNSDNIITLPTDESHHLTRVMRLKKASVVLVVDGLGMAFLTEVVSTSKSGVTARILKTQRNFGEPLVRLTLANGLSAGSKFDTTVQKGTELGVKRFVPVVSEKSRVTIDDPRKANNKVKRYERVALSAMKQCRRSYRPDVAAPITLTDFLKETDKESINLLFHPSDKARPLDQVDFNPDIRRVTALVGPESGFSDGEVEMAESVGFTSVSLGQRILRTETAGPTACTLIMQALGEFR